MSTALATVAGIAVLAAAGFLPVLATVGLRWCAVPLAPLAGTVVAGLAATASLSFGGSLLDWFLGLAAGAVVVVCAVFVVRPDLGIRAGPRRRGRDVPDLVAGAVGFGLVVLACAWSLRGLRTPTVGFDARALWVMRPGWFLQSHRQLLIDMRVKGLVLNQSAYPPLLSAAVAVVWKVTGIHTARLGVTTVAVLDACVLAAAALAVLQVARTAASRVARRWIPLAVGVAAAVLLVVVAAGVTEPFLTNGYADPLWSLAAVGAVAYGLQLRDEPSARSAAVILVLVAGMTKNEGFATSVALVVLIAARAVGRPGRHRTPGRWVAPVVVAVGELALLAWWPELMKVIHARGATTAFSLSQDIAHRSDAVAHGMSPYLHVLVVALAVSVAGAAVLRQVRRDSEVGNDLWAWLALAFGLVALGGALVTGSGAIGPWILTTVHRITEYPCLQGWWIVAVWAVVAAAGLAGPAPRSPGRRRAGLGGDPDERGRPRGSAEVTLLERRERGPLDDPTRTDGSGPEGRHAGCRGWRSLLAGAIAYLALSVGVWWNIWSTHPTSTTTCGCGDTSLFTWFLEWPAFAISHGLNPLYSTYMFHPTGVNLLSNTAEVGVGVLLAPVTWLFGPVATLNVALTLSPFLSALAAYVLARRFVSWAPAAFAAGLLYGFSPFVLTSLSDAHLMLGLAPVPPLIVLCLDEMVVRQRWRPVAVGLALGLLATVQFFIGTEVLVIAASMAAVGLVLVLAAGLTAWRTLRARLPYVLRCAVWTVVTSVVLLAYPAWFALAGPAHLSGSIWGNGGILNLGGSVTRNFLHAAAPDPKVTALAHQLGGTRDRSSPRSSSGGGCWPSSSSGWSSGTGTAGCGSSASSAWWPCSCR